MTNVDFGRYKRLVQYFWDPEPTNVDGVNLPIWCLGREYAPTATSEAINPTQTSTDNAPRPEHSLQQTKDSTESLELVGDSYPSSIVTDEPHATQGEDEGGWPVSFLDDFEAKVWLTYRSNFPAITKSEDPKALSAMTFSVRWRSTLVDQGGFTSDTGWGCMIRSGQCLLANALLILRLGRG
jgi:cysteine protease ATG4